MSNRVGKSSIQGIFAVLEVVSGEVARPKVSDYIASAGDSSMTQTPSFSNSEEKTRSLNTLEQFQDAMPPADFSVPTYLRTQQAYGALQADAMLTSAFGIKQDTGTVGAVLSGALATSGTTMDVNTVTGGVLLPRGVVSIGAELIRYTFIIDNKDGSYTLNGLTRGYNNSTIESHTDGAVVMVVSVGYRQSIERPTFTLWRMIDHTVQFATGCTITSTEIPLSNSGGQMITFSGNGRRMGYVGNAEITSAAQAVITLKEEKAHYAFNEGGLVYNSSIEDNNSDLGYQIVSVDRINNKLTLEKSVTGWLDGHVISPFLPEQKVIGTPTESREASIYYGDVAMTLTPTKQLEGSLTIGTPTEYLNEIGDKYVGLNADNSRDISLTGDLVFYEKNAYLLGESLEGYEKRMDIELGDMDGDRIVITMPRVKYNAIEPATNGAFMTLTQNAGVMGDSDMFEGESAIFLTVE